MDFEKLCQDVFKVDDDIRSARVINGRGRLIAGGMRKDLDSLEEQKRDEMLFMELTLRARMRHEFDEEFGQVKFAMSFRDKVIFISFPMLDENILLVSGNPNLDFNKSSFEILKLIK